MADHHCPHCGTSVRGRVLLSMPAQQQLRFLLSSEIRCPACQASLLPLPNPRQFAGLLVALLFMSARLWLDAMAHPDLDLALQLLTLLAFLFSAVAVFYWPRYQGVRSAWRGR